MSQPAHVGRLRQALAPLEDGTRRLINIPGCWDGLSALLIEQTGFPAAFLTGGGLSMARFGRPDLGLVTSTELEETVRVIRDRVDIPLLVDADTGFGGSLNAARTFRGLERAGASAIQIEDQAFPKRCGHMAGKVLAPIDEALARLHAALDVREHALLVARTDAVSVDGLDAAIERAEAYLAAGADLIFVEGPRTLEETRAVAERFGARAPLVHNLVEGGVSATDSGAELEALGFAVVLHPLTLLHAFARIAPAILDTLRSARSSAALVPGLADLGEMNRLTGAAALLDFDQACAAAAAAQLQGRPPI